MIPVLTNPFKLFEAWMALAEQSEINDPNAMALATADETGMPSVRMVLLKGVEDSSILFYTNLESQKGQELLETGKAAVCFYWKSLLKQVRMSGMVEQLDDTMADQYFRTRPRMSKIGAWASRQSRPLASMADLENQIREYDEKFRGEDIPRPPHWSGFRLVPDRIEFWDEGKYRLHERLVYTKNGTRWMTQRLHP